MISSYGAIASGRPRQLTYEKNQSRIGGTLWEFPNRFIDNSPIFVVDRITTPVLILHNDADPNTPFAGAIEFYLALRRLRKEVYLLNYPGEGHDLENWAHGKDFAIRMQQFFDHHLKGAQAPEWMAAGIPSVEPR
jgi:dipeptidyl aminopeptidase/acylaminoacyl peptidase